MLSLGFLLIPPSSDCSLFVRVQIDLPGSRKRSTVTVVVEGQIDLKSVHTTASGSWDIHLSELTPMQSHLVKGRPHEMQITSSVASQMMPTIAAHVRMRPTTFWIHDGITAERSVCTHGKSDLLRASSLPKILDIDIFASHAPRVGCSTYYNMSIVFC